MLRWRGGAEAGACTESLGSESGDVGFDADEIDRFFTPAPAGCPDDADAALCGADERPEPRLEEEEKEKRRRWRAAGGWGGFPPPMPRASGPLFLRAERRGGRLILTEARADERVRRVVFRAERHGGRLRLRFASDEEEEEVGGGGNAGAGDGGGVAVQHGGGGELCQVAAAAAAVAGRRGVEVGAVMMGTI